MCTRRDLGFIIQKRLGNVIESRPLIAPEHVAHLVRLVLSKGPPRGAFIGCNRSRFSDLPRERAGAFSADSISSELISAPAGRLSSVGDVTE